MDTRTFLLEINVSGAVMLSREGRTIATYRGGMHQVESNVDLALRDLSISHRRVTGFIPLQSVTSGLSRVLVVTVDD